MWPLRTLAPWLLLAVLCPRCGGARGRGRFALRGGAQCTWAARDAGSAVRLSVRCGHRDAGAADTTCEYAARPQACPGYLSDPGGFWKQVGRALQRLQGALCADRGAQVRPRMCKRAPRDAVFKLDVRSSAPSAGPEIRREPEAARPPPPPPPSAAPTACTARANHRRRSEEHCGSWASVCTFFFSMLQSDSDC